MKTKLTLFDIWDIHDGNPKFGDKTDAKYILSFGAPAHEVLYGRGCDRLTFRDSSINKWTNKGRRRFLWILSSTGEVWVTNRLEASIALLSHQETAGPWARGEYLTAFYGFFLNCLAGIDMVSQSCLSNNFMFSFDSEGAFRCHSTIVGFSLRKKGEEEHFS